MKFLKSALIWITALAVIALASYIFVNYYGYIFKKKITGRIDRVERVQVNVALMQGGPGDNKLSSELYSFAVAIKDDKGEIWTASSEDRQWAAVTPGLCAESEFFPYPPWNLQKSGTYHNARLTRMWVCQ